MTAPIRMLPEAELIDGRYEVYRVVLDYEALHGGFEDRIEDLNTTLEQIELAGGLAKGEVQKLLTHTKGRSSRTLGRESLAKMLKGTGLALVLVVDDARFAPLKAMLKQRARPRQPAMAGSRPAPWLFKREKAREMGKKRFSMMTESERKRHQRKAGKASARARRRKASALLDQAALASSAHGQSPPNTSQTSCPQV